MYRSRSAAFVTPDKGDRFGGGKTLCVEASNLSRACQCQQSIMIAWCDDRSHHEGYIQRRNTCTRIRLSHERLGEGHRSGVGWDAACVMSRLLIVVVREGGSG